MFVCYQKNVNYVLSVYDAGYGSLSESCPVGFFGVGKCWKVLQSINMSYVDSSDYR